MDKRRPKSSQLKSILFVHPSFSFRLVWFIMLELIWRARILHDLYCSCSNLIIFSSNRSTSASFALRNLADVIISKITSSDIFRNQQSQKVDVEGLLNWRYIQNMVLNRGVKTCSFVFSKSSKISRFNSFRLFNLNWRKTFCSIFSRHLKRSKTSRRTPSINPPPCPAPRGPRTSAERVRGATLNWIQPTSRLGSNLVINFQIDHNCVL